MSLIANVTENGQKNSNKIVRFKTRGDAENSVAWKLMDSITIYLLQRILQKEVSLKG